MRVCNVVGGAAVCCGGWDGQWCQWNTAGVHWHIAECRGFIGPSDVTRAQSDTGRVSGRL